MGSGIQCICSPEERRGVMDHISGAFAIEGIIAQKQSCEKEMAEAILAAIDNSPSQEIRGVIRQLVANSVQDVEDIIAAKGEAAFQKAYDKDAHGKDEHLGKAYGFVQQNKLDKSDKFLTSLKIQTISLI